MLYFILSFFSFILLSRPWDEDEIRMIISAWFQKSTWLALISSCFSFPTLFITPLKKKMIKLGANIIEEKVEEEEEEEEKEEIINPNPLLDLPELALESILERLSPSGLCNMSAVCRYFREKCKSDLLWEKHVNEKWGKVINGDSANQAWPLHIASTTRKRSIGLLQVQGQKKSNLFESFFCGWFLSFIRPNLESNKKNVRSCSSEVESLKAKYLSLENGLIWFPAQVYNRENGHAGFMLSCYDAHVCYDRRTDTFQARYLPHERRSTEENIKWDRLRTPPVDTPPHVPYISNCLNELKPGDHIEIQWRRNEEFPYGWWYGVVGHLNGCSRDTNCCCCSFHDNVILEFNQYTPDSRWRRMVINRKEHTEEGNEADGFYGGVRKIYSEEEITRWKHLWPSQDLE